MISLVVDGTPVQVEPGATVLEAARKAGADVPTLCYREGCGPGEACRICTVEVTQGGRTRLQASCALPAAEGMEVKTATERVLRGRRMLAELLLARSPGVKAVQDLARSLGVESSRFPAKNEDCILCGLCVRACSEIMGVGAIGFTGRGVERKVEPPFGGRAEACRACGACTFVCPTGKMQMEAAKVKEFRLQSGADRQCRFARMGFFSSKLCHNHYDCAHCQVDQIIEETLGTHPAFVTVPGSSARGEEVFHLRFFPDIHYHLGHTWVRPVEGRALAGIDDFAALVLHPAASVVLPEPGRVYGQGETAFRIESPGKKAVFPMPVSGRVVDVNPDLRNAPSLTSSAPFSRGWVAVVETDRLRPDLAQLLHRHEARKWLEREGRTLAALLGRAEKRKE